MSRWEPWRLESRGLSRGETLRTRPVLTKLSPTTDPEYTERTRRHAGAECTKYQVISYRYSLLTNH